MGDLTQKDIDDILRLIDGSNFDELKLEMGELKLEVRRGGWSETSPSKPAIASPISNPAPELGAGVAKKPIENAAEIKASTLPSGEGADVPAPLLGTFYRSPKPGADPFISVGDTVTEDTVIGIIEVMKLMNSVTANVAGTVTEIVANDGQLVEHGQSLIRVQPA